MLTMERLTPLTDVTDVAENKPVSIVIPAYNEANRIERSLTDVRTIFDFEYNSDYELLVVDDGSDDDTPYIALTYGAKVLRVPENKGKGNAVRLGMLESDADYRMFMDADGSFKAIDAVRLLDIVMATNDIAIAVRHQGRDSLSKAHESRFRALGSRVMASIGNHYLPVNVSDTQCGMKAFPGSVVEALLPLTKSNGFIFDRESLNLAEQEGFNIIEVPVDIDPMDGSKVRPLRDGLRMAREARRISQLHKAA